jgi:hypothetical protein
MKRFYSLSVDRLEDRCVPADLVGDVQAIVTTQVLVADVSTDPSAGTVVIVAPTDSTQFVIDVYPIDPNGVPVDPVQPTNPPIVTDPVEIVPPIDSPFWF